MAYPTLISGFLEVTRTHAVAMRARGTIAIVAAALFVGDFGIAQDVQRDPDNIEQIATGLRIPWAFAFLPDGRILVSERPGLVRVVTVAGGLEGEPWLANDFNGENAVEFVGLALAPDYELTRRVYLLATFRSDDPAVTKGADWEHRLYRFTDAKRQASEPELVRRYIPAGSQHGGGRIAFGPDGKLYMSTGDSQQAVTAQDPLGWLGKVLRFNADGTIPADNPVPDSPVIAIGVRNPHGLAWHPDTDELFATEHGPTNFPGEGGRRHQDELNVIRFGENYGWPIVSGMSADPDFFPPIVEWTPAIAPAGIEIVDKPGSRWDRSVFVAALRGQHLRHIELERAPTNVSRTNWRIKSDTPLFLGKFGRLRVVAQGIDGYLYFASEKSIYRFEL